MYYFNPENSGFYLEKEKGFVELTDKQYRALIAGQSEGNSIVIGDDGRPGLKPVTLTDDELILSASSKRDSLLGVAALRIAPLQYAVDLGSATQAEIDSLALWKQFSVDVNRVVDQPSYPKDINWPKEPS